jgi:uncharacterized protein (UPF0276 family)
MFQKNDIPNLGIGIGLRAIHYEEIFKQKPAVDWFEIISENFIDASKHSMEYLDWLLDHYPVVMHGVSLSIGSADPLDFHFLKQLKSLARKTKTPWLSDHLAWGRLAGSHYHDLLPLPYRRDVCAYVANRARIVQDFLEIPFALENVSSYAHCKDDEMSEWEFYAEVVEQANISMMLDVNNLYISSRNHGFSPKDYFKYLPLNRVVQIHLAGHLDYELYCLDSHDHPVCDEVWKLYGEIYPLTGPVSTLLEWDDQFISFQKTWEEALKAKKFQKEIQIAPTFI